MPSPIDLKVSMQQQKPIDSQNLMVFVTVAEERNMSNAAKKLGITQPAVSLSIRQIEEQLGVVLVNRERRPLELTPAGVTLRNRAVVLLNEISLLPGLVRDASSGIKPDLRLGLVDSFASTIGPEFINRMLPHASTLSVRTGLSPYHSEALIGRGLDLIISSEPLIDFDNISRKRLLSEKFIVITPRARSLTVRTIAEFKHLANTLPMVRFARDSHLGAQIERFLRRIDARVPSTTETDRADTVTSIVAAGVGWAVITPLCLLQGHEYSRRVNVHVLSDSHSDRSLYLLGRRDEYEQLMNHCFHVASELMQDHLPKRLLDIDPSLTGVIEIAPD